MIALKKLQGNYYTTCCLLDYPYFKTYKIIAIDLRKQQVLDAAPKAMQQINFTGSRSSWKRNNVFHY